MRGGKPEGRWDEPIRERAKRLLMLRVVSNQRVH